MFRSAGTRIATAILPVRPSRRVLTPLSKGFHATQRTENALILGGAAILGAAVTVRYALAAYETYKESQPPAAVEEPVAEEPKANSSTSEQPLDEKAEARARAESKADAKAKEEPSVFSSWFARNYYEGGFEEKMTRREAALILGVRETATVERIKEAHRRVLILNHPDRGGSAFVSAKINEAKDLLLKGRD